MVAKDNDAVVNDDDNGEEEVADEEAGWYVLVDDDAGADPFLGLPLGRGLGTHLKPNLRHLLHGMDLCGVMW